MGGGRWGGVEGGGIVHICMYGLSQGRVIIYLYIPKETVISMLYYSYYCYFFYFFYLDSLYCLMYMWEYSSYVHVWTKLSPFRVQKIVCCCFCNSVINCYVFACHFAVRIAGLCRPLFRSCVSASSDKSFFFCVSSH